MSSGLSNRDYYRPLEELGVYRPSRYRAWKQFLRDYRYDRAKRRRWERATRA